MPVRVPVAGTSAYATESEPGVAPVWSSGTVTAPALCIARASRLGEARKHREHEG